MAGAMCVIEKGGKKCKKCIKDKQGCYWARATSTNKGKAPQKTPAPKRLIPVVEIKTTHPRKLTQKVGKSQNMYIFVCTDSHLL